VEGIAEQLAGFADERVVDAPGVDGDAVELSDGDFGEATLHFVPETENVPMDGVVGADGLVGEAGYFGDVEEAIAKAGENGAAAFGAEVEG
jgi:hypothetical protein